MSVQVSYKKQTLLGIFGLIIIFSVIEIAANVWWLTQVNCEFEDSEIFSQMDDKIKRQLCVDLYDIKTSGEELIPNQESQSIVINSLGFRGDEFSPDKPEHVYRIFMLGGSTMFGYGATADQTTIPGYVQQYFQNNYEGLAIEVINAGIQGADSTSELNLIQTKLLNYEPNMVIIYDGWNDLRAQNSDEFIQSNWKAMCQLGKENNFDTIIALQPIAGFGNKILTEQESVYSKTGVNYANTPLINSLIEYEKYAKNLEALSDCTLTTNLRGVFDTESSPIYWDQGHVSDKGNRLIGKAVYDEIVLLLPDDLSESIKSVYDVDNVRDNSSIEKQIQYVLSSYKTPLMIEAIISFEQTIEKAPNTNFQNSMFKTQSQMYDDDEIFIEIEILNSTITQKKLKIQTVSKNDNTSISHVTYFLKILKNNEVILNEFFYVEDDVLILDVITDNSDSINITGTRQYDHNAIIASVEPAIQISGPILENNISYDFHIELRTIYEKSNWIFSLDDFEVMIKP